MRRERFMCFLSCSFSFFDGVTGHFATWGNAIVSAMVVALAIGTEGTGSMSISSVGYKCGGRRHRVRQIRVFGLTKLHMAMDKVVLIDETLSNRFRREIRRGSK